MKKKGFSKLLLAFVILLIILVSIVVCYIVFFDEGDRMKLLYDITKDLLSAVVVGIILGAITTIISNKLFSVEINMKKMREFGIGSIGTGISTDSDVCNMFGGGKWKKSYPREIKLLFLTGNVFLRVFRDRLIESMDAGCEICLLIVSPEKENEEYLKRCSYRFSNGEKDYVKEVNQDSLKTIAEIYQISKHPENLKVRFYKDEYQNNIRISRYFLEENKIKTYYWINVQPLTKTAIDLSIALKGTLDEDFGHTDAYDKNNLCAVSEEGFDLLWKTYENTEKNVNTL